MNIILLAPFWESFSDSGGKDFAILEGENSCEDDFYGEHSQLSIFHLRSWDKSRSRCQQLCFNSNPNPPLSSRSWCTHKNDDINRELRTIKNDLENLKLEGEEEKTDNVNFRSMVKQRKTRNIFLLPYIL